MDKNNASRMAKSYVLVHALKPQICVHTVLPILQKWAVGGQENTITEFSEFKFQYLL